MDNYLPNNENNLNNSMQEWGNLSGFGGFKIGQIVDIKVDKIDLVSQIVFLKISDAKS